MSNSFEDTVKNLLKMKPKPHKAKADDEVEKGREEPAPSEADHSKSG